MGRHRTRQYFFLVGNECAPAFEYAIGISVLGFSYCQRWGIYSVSGLLCDPMPLDRQSDPDTRVGGSGPVRLPDAPLNRHGAGSLGLLARMDGSIRACDDRNLGWDHAQRRQTP